MQTRQIINLCKTKEVPADELARYSVCELKADGNFAVIRNDNGKREVVTRTPTWLRYEGHDWWEYLFANLPPDSIVVAEMYVPGKDSYAVKSALAAEPTEELAVAIFGALKWDGVDVSNEPVGFLQKITPLAVKLACTRTVDPLNPPQGYDGVILKSSVWPKWIGDWKKIKPKKTVDLRYTGEFTHGKDDFKGMVGSVLLRSDDGKLKANVSGMSMFMRKAFTAGSIPVGTVCEVSYRSVATKGGFRHPQFERIREDKTETTAAWELL